MDIYFSDYEHLIADGNATLAAVEAARTLCQNPGATLHLEPKEYHFYTEHAFQKEYYISNNDYSRKNVIFPLLGAENITVDGNGADLLFHGEVVPFVIDKAKNVTLKNFKVDYPNPYFFQADIVEAREDYLEITFDTNQFHAKIEGDEIVFFNEKDGWSNSHDRLLTCEFDNDTTAPSAFISPYFIYFPAESDGWFLDSMYRYVKGEQLADDRICFKGHFKHTHTVGNKLIATCGPGRRCPGIFGNDSENIEIVDVTLHSTASMGVICQLCENVTLLRVKTVPREGSGRFLSVNADSTHFVNCSRTVKLQDCVFTNMLDDACNVHGNYMKINRKINDNTLLLEFGHEQQEGVNVYKTGDKVRLVDNMKMTEMGIYTVKEALLISAKFVRLELQEKIGEYTAGNTIENFTRMPEFIYDGCVSGWNRPRGILPSTWRKTRITNNTFFNMNQGVCFTGDSNDWFEAGHNEDVVISGNKFRNSAYAGGTPISVAPHVLEGEEPYHRNIIIENNEFEMSEKRFLHLSFCENVVFRNNKYIHNPLLPSHGQIGEDGFGIYTGCRNLDITPPEEIEK